MKSPAVSTKQAALPSEFSDDKFAMIARAIRWAFDVTRNPGLARLEVTAGPAGVVVSGEGDLMDEWWAKFLAEKYSRGLPVTCNVRPNGSGKGDHQVA